jgi:DNA (cytosine-5)-methyltransferase 1
MSLTVGSLFSGIGGFDLGLERAGMSVRWQVENNDYCTRVLAKHWPGVPRYGDIKTINWQTVEAVDLVCGGFPCQPFSCAGKQRGEADDRYLWPEVVRGLDALRPAWFLGENVPGLIKMALDQVCADLESLGYTVWPVCVPACAIDAPHIRQRVWIMAHQPRPRLERAGYVTGTDRLGAETGLLGCSSEIGIVADTDCGRFEQLRGEEPHKQYDEGAISRTQCFRCDALAGATWLPEPAVGRVAHGVSARVDRLRGLGNAVVPQVVEALGRMMLEAHNGQR